MFNNVPVNKVGKIPFWENLWPAAAGGGLTATQGIYQQFLDTGGDFTTALYNLDVDPCSPCSIFGPFAMFNSQYSSLYSLRSRGGGNYHAMQWTIRKRFSQGYQFDFNYTWSKSIDLASTRETDGVLSSAVINAWFPGQNKAVSDYDTTHIFTAVALAELPFGKGKRFLSNANSFVDAIFGGWTLSGVFHNTSGFPVGVNDGAGWAEHNWEFESYATQTGIVPAPHTTQDATSAAAGAPGGPNIFADPAAAYNAYSFTAAGERPGSATVFVAMAFSESIWGWANGSTCSISETSRTPCSSAPKRSTSPTPYVLTSTALGWTPPIKPSSGSIPRL